VYVNVCAGDPNSNWAWFEKQKAAFVNLKVNFSAGDLPEFEENNDLSSGHKLEVNWRKLGPSVIVKASKIGKASDFWNRYKEDIQRAKDLGDLLFIPLPFLPATLPSPPPPHWRISDSKSSLHCKRSFLGTISCIGSKGRVSFVNSRLHTHGLCSLGSR